MNHGRCISLVANTVLKAAKCTFILDCIPLINYSHVLVELGTAPLRCFYIYVALILATHYVTSTAANEM